MINKFKSKIARNLIIDKDNDYRNTLLLVGSGRSGTTWVSDILNYNNEYRYIFEPFHPKRVELCKDLGHRKYIHPDIKDNKMYEKFLFILSGNLRNSWSDYYNKKIFTKKRLIKEIRINLCLKWVKNNFSEIKIVYLLRNPFPTAISKDKFNLHSDINDYINQENLMNDYFSPFKNEIIKAREKSDFEKNIFIWCIENYLPLKLLNKNEMILTFYENFCSSPELEIKKTFTYIEKDFNAKIFKTLNKPSAVSRNWSAINTGQNLINSWKEKITKDELTKGLEILHLFGMDSFYNEDSIPNIENIEDFRNQVLK